MAPQSLSTIQPSTTRTSDWVVYQDEVSGCMVVLNATSDPLTLHDVDFASQTCFVYSENILISDATISLPGKNFGLFCSTLTLANPTLTISVSGADGEPETVVESNTNGDDGNAGTNAGSVWLYVENMNDDLMNSLTLLANGGNGGTGGSTTYSDGVGGTGGNGGNGGGSNLYYGCPARSIWVSLREAVSQPWLSQVDAAKNVLDQCQTLPQSYFPSGLDSNVDIQAQYAAFSISLPNFSVALNNLVVAASSANTFQPTPSSTTTVAAQACKASLTQLQLSTSAPLLSDLASGAFSTIDSTTANIITWLGQGGDSLETTIDTELDALTQQISSVLSNSSISDLYNLWEDVGMSLENMELAWQRLANTRICNASSGMGGLGGDGPFETSPLGAMGSNGTNGTISAVNLAFDGVTQSDVAISQVCAFPEQCQMVLNVADDLFLTNDQTNVSTAFTYYQRLNSRLAFVQMLNGTDSSGSPLLTAYTNLENNMQLSTSCVAQLQSILALAQLRMNRICLGMDMFGHPANWAPRLSYTTYQVELANTLGYLTTSEQTAECYYAALQNNNSADAAISQGYDSSANSISSAQAKLQALTAGTGIIPISAGKVKAYTPLLTTARADIKQKVQAVQTDIQHQLNLDPQYLLDAFATLSMAGSSWNAAAMGTTQSASALYKAFTTVQNSEGVDVNKDYVLSQIGTCGADLSSLNEAVQRAPDGTLTPDDPGSLKIIATVDDMIQLMDQYKKAIPGGDYDALKTALDDYLKIIQERNNAVIDYNVGLHLAQEALTNVQYYTAQKAKLGTAALESNPQLPSIYYWLEKTVRDLQLDAMQQLSYAASAVCFWGVTPPMEFASPGPLQPQSVLEGYNQQLSKCFDDCTAARGTVSWTMWPRSLDDGSGYLYELNTSALAEFLTPQKRRDGSDAYEVWLSWGVDFKDFAGDANVRLSQVRVWLPGAKCKPDGQGRQLLKVEIEQLGNETLVGLDGTKYEFTHDAVSMQFQYDASQVQTIKDATPQVWQTVEALDEAFPNATATDYTNVYAAIGPLARWRITVDGGSENVGLDLTNVKQVYVELCGRNLEVAR